MALNPIQNTAVVALQLEKVRKKLPVLYERADTFFSMIEKKDVLKTSTRNARIPLQAKPGGAFGYASFDGGDLGRGSGTFYDVAQLSPIGMRLAVEINKIVEYATDASEKSVANATKTEVANAMKTFRRDIDAQLQTDGTGAMGTIASGGATTTWTLNNTPFGARLLRPGMKVQLCPTGLASSRGTAVITDVTNMLGQPQTVTIDVAIGAGITGDVILPDGLTTPSPVGMYGIPYHHNNATSGTWLTLNRTNSYCQANLVDATSTGLALPYLRKAVDNVMQQIGIEEQEALKSLVWYGHRAQKAAYHEIAFSISSIQKKNGNEDFDLMFGGESIGGVKTRWSIHADPSRLDLINLDTWGRVEWKEVDFFEIGGNTVFPVYNSGSGGLAAAYLFYLVTGMQFFIDNPRAISSVINLALPSGY